MKGALQIINGRRADVAEIYSEPRIAHEAAIRKYGGEQLVPGWSLDLTREDPLTGRSWDLSKRTVRESEAAGARDQAVYADWLSHMHSILPAAEFVSEQTRSKGIC